VTPDCQYNINDDGTMAKCHGLGRNVVTITGENGVTKIHLCDEHLTRFHHRLDDIDALKRLMKISKEGL
jgi:hypothetical protein